MNALKHLFTVLLLLCSTIVMAETITVNGIKYYVDTIKKQAEVIGSTAGFSGDIVIPATIEYSAEVYNVTSIEAQLFGGCVGLTSIAIPSSINEIGSGAFCDCSALTSATIGNKIKDICFEAFYGCDNLKDVYCLATTAPEISNYAFNQSKIENVTLHVPVVAINSYKANRPWNYFGSIVTYDGNNSK